MKFSILTFFLVYCVGRPRQRMNDMKHGPNQSLQKKVISYVFCAVPYQNNKKPVISPNPTLHFFCKHKDENQHFRFRNLSDAADTTRWFLPNLSPARQAKEEVLPKMDRELRHRNKRRKKRNRTIEA